MTGDTARGAGTIVLACALALGMLAGADGGAAAAERREPITDECPAEVDERRFRDVNAGTAHARAIDCAAWWGIARGVEDGTYRPRGQVLRGQMASFVARLIRSSEGPLPASPADPFSDDGGSVHHYAVNRLAAVGVVQGMPDGTYRPHAPVSRAQMASFLVRSVEQRTGRALTAGRDRFFDDDGSVHEEAVNKAAEAGLALGVGPGRFDPNAVVTRAQMASFLVRGLSVLVEGGHVEDSPATLRRASALRTFDACEDLLGYLKEEALELVGPYGLHGHHVATPVDGGLAEDGGGEEGAPAAPAEPGADFSDTNVQEEGVDEADVVKTDGRQLLTIAGGRLHRIDVSGATPAPTGSLAVDGFGSELLLAGNRALVMSGVFRARTDGRYEDETAVLRLVDVTEGAAMRETATLHVDGFPVSARMVDGVARVVVRSSPTLPFVFPDHRQADGEAAAARRNREIVEDSTLDDWLPGYTRTNEAGETVGEGALLDCGQVARPPEFSGLDLLSVLTVDLSGELSPEASAGVAAAGQTVYASPTGLYVATTRWDVVTATSPVDGATTEIHAFDISDPRIAIYRASGKVDGVVLNQFALSEHAGVLRVATTSQPAREATSSVSQVIVLQARDSTLEEIGRVGGLGLGERIQAVRFIGDLGYVVTFRQVDPLYTIDLSDPTAPAVRGELKILGYSAYLHPVGDGLLLGVGVDADEDGQRLGTQVSLFDVTDAAAPRRLHQASVAGGSSEVELDHRAFLWWAPTGRAVLPLHAVTFDERTGEEDGFIGVAGFDVDVDAGIREVGRVAHEEGRDGGDGSFWSTPSIRRSVVVGDVLYTVSERGVKASDLSSMADRAWVPFR